MALLDGEYFHSLHSLVFWIEASLARTPFHGVAPRRDHATRHLSRCCECMEFGRKKRAIATLCRAGFQASFQAVRFINPQHGAHANSSFCRCRRAVRRGATRYTKILHPRSARFCETSGAHVTIVKKDEFVVLSRIVGKTTILTACAHPDERHAGSAATRTLFCPGAQRVVPTALAGHTRQSDHESNSS